MVAEAVQALLREAEILISSKKIILAGLFIGFTALAAAPHGGGIAYGSGFGMPDYRTQAELVTYVVAPFVFISVLLQTALIQVFKFTVFNGENRTKAAKQAKRPATLVALGITGTLVATPFWGMIRTIGSAIGLTAAITLLVIFVLLLSWAARGR